MNPSGNKKKNDAPAQIILGAVFFCAGLAVIVWGIVNINDAVETSKWPAADGVVVRSDVEYRRDNDGGSSYFAVIEYEYAVEGRDYRSDRVSFFEYGSSNSGHARGVARKYPQGAAVTVYYDPDDIGSAVLEKGIGWIMVLPLVIGVPFAIAGYTIFKSGRKKSEMNSMIGMSSASVAAASMNESEVTGEDAEDVVHALFKRRPEIRGRIDGKDISEVDVEGLVKKFRKITYLMTFVIFGVMAWIVAGPLIKEYVLDDIRKDTVARQDAGRGSEIALLSAFEKPDDIACAGDGKRIDYAKDQRVDLPGGRGMLLIGMSMCVDRAGLDAAREKNPGGPLAWKVITDYLARFGAAYYSRDSGPLSPEESAMDDFFERRMDALEDMVLADLQAGGIDYISAVTITKLNLYGKK